MNVEPSLLNESTLISVETIIAKHNLVETEELKKSQHSHSLSRVKCSVNPSSQIGASFIYICNMKIKSTIARHIHTKIKFI